MPFLIFYSTIIVLIFSYISSTNYNLKFGEDQTLNRNLLQGAFLAIFIAALGPMITIGLDKIYGASIESVGPVGDWLSGSTVPFLTFGAFLLAYATYSGQKVELELSRKEFKQQNITLNIQRFENSFFILIKELQRIHDSNRIRNDFGPELTFDAYSEMVDIIRVACKYSKEELEKEYNNVDTSTKNAEFLIHKFIFHRYVNGIGSVIDKLNFYGLDTIFDYTNKIFELIRRHTLSDDDAIFYSDFLRIYLSNDVLVSMMYYSLSGLTQKNSCFNEFKKYDFFKDLLNNSAAVDKSDYKFFNYLSIMNDVEKQKIDPSIFEIFAQEKALNV